MVFFYVLLLSLAEQIGFGLAYLVAAAASGGMLATYVGMALQSRTRGLVMLAVFATLYGLLFLILKLGGLRPARRRHPGLRGADDGDVRDLAGGLVGTCRRAGAGGVGWVPDISLTRNSGMTIHRVCHPGNLRSKLSGTQRVTPFPQTARARSASGGSRWCRRRSGRHARGGGHPRQCIVMPVVPHETCVDPRLRGDDVNRFPRTFPGRSASGGSRWCRRRSRRAWRRAAGGRWDSR